VFAHIIFCIRDHEYGHMYHSGNARVTRHAWDTWTTSRSCRHPACEWWQGCMALNIDVMLLEKLLQIIATFSQNPKPSRTHCNIPLKSPRVSSTTHGTTPLLKMSLQSSKSTDIITIRSALHIPLASPRVSYTTLGTIPSTQDVIIKL